MAFTFRQLVYFVAVAENGTVSGAAHELRISQSAITEAIKELESDLGIGLFERHARGLRLTFKGNQFLRHAMEILARVGEARQWLRDDSGTTSGRLQIGVTPLVAGYVLSDVLARYRRACPAVEIAAIEDGNEYIEHLLIGGELDVAIMIIPDIRELGPLATEIMRLSSYRLWLPLGHRFTSAATISLSDVMSEPFVMLAMDEIEEATSRMLAAVNARPRVAFRTRSVEAVRSLVATGMGIALLPDIAYRPWSLDGDKIETRDITAALPVVQVGVVWRRGSTLSQAALDFIAVAHRSVR